MATVIDKSPVIEEGFIDVPEAARFLKLSRAKVYMLMDAGELAYAKFGRSRRIPRRALLAYASRCLVSRSTKGASDD